MDHNPASLPTPPLPPSPRSRWSRFADQTSTPPTTNRQTQVSKWIRFDGPGNQPPKTISTTIREQHKQNGDLRHVARIRFSGLAPREKQWRTTMSAPKPSPIHHVNQSDEKSAHSAAPPRHRLKLPIVALTSGASTAAQTTNVITSPTESSDLPPTSDSLQQPVRNERFQRVSDRDAEAEPAGMSVNKFAASAPRKMPGQSRRPKISSEAIAIPVGGQTGVTFECSEASERPSSAAAK